MRSSIRGKALLVGVCILAGPAVWAQQTQRPIVQSNVSADLALTFAVERAQVVPGQASFWFKGGGADAAVTFWKGLGVAASLTGDTTLNLAPGVNINKLTYLGGPRYTRTVWHDQAGSAEQRRLQIFAQGLFGAAHGFDGFYPASPAPTTSANSFAVQAGGGLNLHLTRSLGIRLLEADYVHTALPNGAANAQNDARVAFGVTYHFKAGQKKAVK
jgi:hypothetical protein